MITATSVKTIPRFSPPRRVEKGIRTEIVSSADALGRLVPEWEALLTRVVRPAPSQSPLWLTTWWRVFGRGTLRVVAFRESGRLVGLLPMYRSLTWHKPGLPFRSLSFLANGEKEGEEIASDAMGPLAEAGYEQRVAELAANLLAGEELGIWDELIGLRVLRDDPANNALFEALRARGFQVANVVESESHYIPLPDSWDGYLEQLSGSRRYRVRRSLRDMETWAGGRLELRCVGSQAALGEGIAVLSKLHADRWRTAGRKGVFSSPRFRAFHEAVMPALLDGGALELLSLHGPSGPVASLYNIIWDNRVLFYQCGRRTELPKKLRPGLVIHALGIQRAIANGRSEYDFLGGRARYKRELSLDKRRLVDFRVVSQRAQRREDARVYIMSQVRRAKRFARPLTSES